MSQPAQSPQSPQASATPAPSGTAAASSSQSSSLSIPQSAPAGLITITQPPQTATSYYKIAPGNTITFGWNFTALLSTPAHLTVSAIGDNGNTYPVGPTDGIIPGDALSVTWDLWSYQQANPTQPLSPTGYQLNIWDERGPGAPLTPGKLHANNQLRFALYTTRDYTPLASWNCGGCTNNNAALSTYTRNPAFVSFIVTFVIMFLSGYALLRHAFRR